MWHRKMIEKAFFSLHFEALFHRKNLNFFFHNPILELDQIWSYAILSYDVIQSTHFKTTIWLVVASGLTPT